MTYEEAVAYIDETPKFTKKNSLEHTKECLRRLGSPQDKFKVIHVAGTNGKGSTCAFLTSILREAGYSCGLFTSPHLVEINERFQINEVNIDNDTFLKAFHKVKALADELVAEGSYHPTYFEMLFLMGLLIFGEKAGIIVPGVPVIFDGNAPDAAEVIRETARKLGSPWYEVKREDTEIMRNTSAGIDFSFRNDYYGDTVFSIPFIARYQVMNSALALKTMEVLRKEIPVSMDRLQEGIKRTRWQGRMETVLPGVIVDGAHNEDGVEKFVETAEHFQQEYPLTLLFSAVDDKDYRDMIQTICDRIHFEHVVVTSVGGYRQVPAEDFARLFENAGCDCVEAVPDLEEAFAKALQLRGEKGMLFCVGSLYLVGEIKDVIRRNKK